MAYQFEAYSPLSVMMNQNGENTICFPSLSTNIGEPTVQLRKIFFSKDALSFIRFIQRLTVDMQRCNELNHSL